MMIAEAAASERWSARRRRRNFAVRPWPSLSLLRIAAKTSPRTVRHMHRGGRFLVPRRSLEIQQITVTRHHEVSSDTVISWSLNLDWSAPAHERESLSQSVAFWSSAKFVQCRHGSLTSDPSTHGNLSVSRSTQVYAGVRLGEAWHQGPPSTQGTSPSNPTHGELARTKQETQFQEVRTRSLVEFVICIFRWPRHHRRHWL